jgi:hypothetical protein
MHPEPTPHRTKPPRRKHPHLHHLPAESEKLPDVEVYPVVEREKPVSSPILAATRQYLVVVGHRSHHTVVLVRSASQGVLHHATCHVAVMPTHP